MPLAHLEEQAKAPLFGFASKCLPAMSKASAFVASQGAFAWKPCCRSRSPSARAEGRCSRSRLSRASGEGGGGGTVGQRPFSIERVKNACPAGSKPHLLITTTLLGVARVIAPSLVFHRLHKGFTLVTGSLFAHPNKVTGCPACHCATLSFTTQMGSHLVTVRL
eukprot:scaffold200717_cov17-Tisochrysis_lutea.AAC.2